MNDSGPNEIFRILFFRLIDDVIVQTFFYQITSNKISSTF